MDWHPIDSPKDAHGQPMFRGMLKLTNDKNENLAGIMWFYDEGPYYTYVMDVNDVSLMRRIGACSTIEGAKQAVDKALAGQIDLSNRASCPRGNVPF